VAQTFNFDRLYSQQDTGDVLGPIQFLRRWLVLRILRSYLPGANARVNARDNARGHASNGRYSVLEAGCGLGNLSLALAKQGYRVDACDLSAAAIRKARSRVTRGPRPNFFVADAARLCPPATQVTGTCEAGPESDSLREHVLPWCQNQRRSAGHLNDCPGSAARCSVRCRYDAVLCLEVLEHVSDDAGMVRNLAKCLRPGGILVCSVPHSMELWSVSDDVMGHLRRYTRQEVRGVLEGAGLSVKRLFTWGYPLVKTYADWRRTTARPVRGYSESGQGVEMYTPRGVLMTLYQHLAFVLNRVFLLDVLFLNRGEGIGIIGVACK